MKKALKKVFGGLNITWPKLIAFAVIMGIWTALMAMFVPDGNSFRDIAVTAEWWVLPAILIIVNTKKPLEAALKVFVFFLISQPLVYLVQVPFNSMGWELFKYYPYWLNITIATFPGAFIGWYIKKDEWYSGIILSVMTVLLVLTAYGYITGFSEHFPNHLLTTIYCLGIIPVFIFGIFSKKMPRIITAVISVAALVVSFVAFGPGEVFETYNNTFLSENDIVLGNDAYISVYSGEAKGSVDMIKYEDEDGTANFNFKVSGYKGKNYYFEITDGDKEYRFKFYFDKEAKVVVIEKV